MLPAAAISFPTRLLRDDPACGAWNMAVDEALLNSTGESNIAVLRLYAWSEPTLSLGYFQRYADRLQHTASLDCPVVRRMSGGGAILHDREATYCLLLPAAHPLATRPEMLYTHAHETAVELIGDEAARLVDAPSILTAADEPFLCFQRRSIGDLVVDDAKVLGSAQRRRGGVVLQHGSLLLGTSRCAPELPGLFTLRPGLQAVERAAWIEIWAHRFGERLGLALTPSVLSSEERGCAGQLQRDKYAAHEWTERR